MTMRRHATLLCSVAALALVLTGCGKSGGGNSALGDAPPGGASATGTPPNTSPSPGANSGGGSGTGGGTGGGTGTGGGGGGGSSATQSPLYPKDAKTYGLEILKAIAAKDKDRVVSLSNLNLYNYAQTQNYPSKNAQWTNTDCTSGSSTTCSYYNQTGDFAQIALEVAKLGGQGAGSSVYIEGGTYPNAPSSYVSAFISAWGFGTYAHMVALSSPTIADHFKATKSYSAIGGAGLAGTPHPCATNSTKTCVDVTQQGGTETLPNQHIIVDTARINAGKPNGIIGYEPAG